MVASDISRIEWVVELAEEIAEDPGLTVLDLAMLGCDARQHVILIVRARDILHASKAENPRITIMGNPLDIVQFADQNSMKPGDRPWRPSVTKQDEDGFVVYNHYSGSRKIEIHVQNNIDIYDADGVRL